MCKTLTFFVLFSFGTFSHAQLLPILFPQPTPPSQPTQPVQQQGQSVSPTPTGAAPAQISVLAYPLGYIVENPVYVIYQNSTRVTLTYDKVNNSEGHGAEVAYGENLWGVSLEYFKVKCDGCKGRVSANAGFTAANTGFGVKVGEKFYSAGVLFNVEGYHRMGLAAELNEIDGSGNRVNGYGIGYTYIGEGFLLSLDGSQQYYENPAFNNKVVVITPGIVGFIQDFQLALSDRITLDNGRKVDDDVWYGLSWGQAAFNISAYSNFDNASSFGLSFFF